MHINEKRNVVVLMDLLLSVSRVHLENSKTPL